MATYTYEWDRDGDGSFAVDISSYVLDCATDRGRKTDLGTIAPGRMSLVLNNHDGRFSPDKAAGPYYGKLALYRRVRFKVTHGSTYGVFWAYLLRTSNKSSIRQQTVTWFLGDIFALWQDMALKLPLLWKVPIRCALDLAVNRAIGDNQCTNPSVEEDLTDYSGLQSVTPARDPTMKIEGDYTVFCDCPGDNAGEGWRYDATGQVTKGYYCLARVWARASETVTLRFRTFQVGGAFPGETGFVTVSVGTTPTLLNFQGFFYADATSCYFDLYTNSAVGVTFWSDGLYFNSLENLPENRYRSYDAGTVEIELVGAYRQPALEVIQAIAESEPRSFFFPYTDGSYEHLRFRDKDYRATRIAAGPQAIFSDDGADTPYHDLILGEDAKDLISEVEVVSQGDHLDENKEVTVFELSPAGQLVAAMGTIKFRARYSQPARDCSLVIDPMLETFEIPAEASDGYGGYTKTGAWPPDSWSCTTGGVNAMIGSYLINNVYRRARTYLRFDTSGIGAGPSVTSAFLRVWVYANSTATDFKLRIRDKAWLAGGLAEADWSAVPGNDALVGELDDTADLPPAGQYVDIPIDDLTKIDKTGDTEWYLSSDREEAATEPTGMEHLWIYTFQTEAKRPRLIVNYSGLDQGSSTFKNYGVGADISITAGAAPLYVTAVEVKGKPLKGTSEESKVIAAAPSPPPVARTLKVALPLQGSRTASMEAEGTRCAARYDGEIRRPALVLRPVTDACLTQMLTRQIGDLIHVENIHHAHGTFIDRNFWIEGIKHRIGRGGLAHETTFYLEEE